MSPSEERKLIEESKRLTNEDPQPYDLLASFYDNPSAVLESPAEDKQPVKITEPAHAPERDNGFVHSSILEVLRDPADANLLIGIARDIIRMRGDNKIDVRVDLSVATVALPVDWMSEVDADMLALRVRRDKLQVTFKSGADVTLITQGKPCKFTYIGALAIMDGVDILCFVPHNTETSATSFDHTRA